MQNQENKTFNDKLSKLRVDIDKIDNQILDLLQERFQIVENVKDLKESNNDQFYIKSAREADMIKSLIKKSAGKLPTSLIVDIWRKIIAFANCSEQPMNIALHNPGKIADFRHILRQYYNDAIKVTNHDTVSGVVMDLESNKSQIAIFALPKSKNDHIFHDWWINLANNTSGIKVFAKIPMIEDSASYDLVALAIKETEKSCDDNSLLCIEILDEVSQSQLESDISANFEHFKILKSAKSDKIHEKRFYLVEIGEFLEEQDQKLLDFKSSKSKPYIRILGIYPKSLDI